MRKKRLLLLLRLTFPYIIILVLPFIALCKIYTTSIDQAFTLEQERNCLTLEQISYQVDTQLRTFSELSQYIAYNQDIIPLLTLEQPISNSSDFYLIYELCSRLPNYKQITLGIEDVYLFFGNLNYMIQIPNAYRLSDFTKTSSLFTPSYMADFLPTYHDNTLLTLGDKLSPELFFATSLPYKNSKNINTQLVISLNEDKLFSELASIEYGSSGGVFVIDSSHTVLSSYLGESFNPAAESLEFNDDYIITSVQSDYSGWTYISIIPKGIITAQLSYIKNTILTLILLTSLGTAIIVICISLRRGLFFLKLFAQPEHLPTPSDPYKQITHMIDSLNSRNHTLSRTIKVQNNLLRSPLIKDILYGSYTSPHHLAKLIHATDLNLTSSAYFTVLIQFTSHSQHSIQSPLPIHHLLREALQDSLTFPYYDYAVDTDHLALLGLQPLLPYEAPTLTDELTYLNTILTSTYHLECIITFSPCCEHLLDVKKVFNHALYYCQYASYLGLTGVVPASTLTIDHSTCFYYPLSTEINLSHALHQKDKNQLQLLLDDIFYINLEQQHLSLEMLEQLVFALKKTLLQNLYQLLETANSQLHYLIHEKISHLNTLYSFPALYACSLEIHQLITQSNTLNQTLQDQELMIKIKSLIATHFTNSCFNLGMLGELCQINEHTLYNLFKNLFGVTFSDYLENYRIQAACELLLQKKIPIKDISILVGYNSDYSFRRAFKRLIGTPPSKYSSTTI